MALDKAIELSLRTWYPVDHPLHFDPLHPALGLAGEAGELLDLYKKERFKDGVSWWDCVHCGHPKDSHIPNGELGYFCNHPQISDATGLEYDCLCPGYTPKILDELGDAWYYMRILAYQSKSNLSKWTEFMTKNPSSPLPWLVKINQASSEILYQIVCGHSSALNEINTNRLRLVFNHFQRLLRQLDFTLDQVTESNYAKLKDGDNHGWKTARDTVP